MKEIWKDIELNGVKPGVYQVSNLGNIRSRATGKWKLRKPSFIKKTGDYGHLTVTFAKGGKHYSVHRLVATAFIPNPGNKPEVNHIDNDTTNNRVDNLEWVTHAENMQWCHSQGKGFMKTKKPVYSIDGDGNRTEYESAREAYSKTGINYKHISACCLGKRKYAGGLRWGFN